MTSPIAYQRLKNFTQFALDHVSDPYNASDHDAELDAVQRTLVGVLANRALIQRDDGVLANDSVHPDSLSTATLLLIEAAGSATGLNGLVRGLWTTATAYTVGQIVQNGTTSYICATNHTSGTFSTDYSAGKWVILGETAAAGAAAMSFSPTGTISATNVQGAIQELDNEKAAISGSAIHSFAVADATTAEEAVSMGQVQKNALTSAIGTGTADALMATVPGSLTVLSDGMEFIIESPGTNTVTAPTLELTLGTTSTGARPIVKGGGTPLIAGDIASNKCKFVYDLSLDKWVLLNPLYSVGVSSSDSDPAQAKNLGLAFAVGSNALSASVVTASGGVPTSSDQVRVAMRSSNAASGTFNVRTISSSLALVISSGSTLGHGSGATSKIHWYLIDNAGTLELAASGMFFGFSGIVSTAAEGGAGAADNYETMYSATARSNVPYTWIGETTDTQTTAGAWANLPSAVNTVPRGMVDAPVPSAVFPLFAFVSGNALTMSLFPCVIDFRHPTQGNGFTNRRIVKSVISTVISSGSTAGTPNATWSRIVLIAMDNNGTVELAWINALGASALREDGFITTVAEGGAGAADSQSQAYSTTARTNLPYRIVGYIESTQPTAGAWSVGPSKVQGAGGMALAALLPLMGVDQVWTWVTASRALATAYTNTAGRPIVLYVSGNASNVNAYLQLVINAANAVTSHGAYAATALVSLPGMVIPHGSTYQINISAGTLTNLSWWELR